MGNIEFVIVFWWIGRQEEEGKEVKDEKNKTRERITHVPVSLPKPIMGPSQREASATEKKWKKINTWSSINTHQTPNASKNWPVTFQFKT